MAAAASRILIDATMARRGGGFTYLVNLLPRLAELAPERSFRVLTRSTALRESLPTASNLDVVTLPAAGYPARLAFSWLRAPGLARAWRADVYFAAGEMAPLFAPCPVIASFRNPNVFTALDQGWDGFQRFRLGALRLLGRVMARSSARILFVSHDSAHWIGESIDLPMAKRAVIHHGIDPIRFTASPAAAPHPRPYVLSVSSIYRYKNFVRLIEAWTLLARRRADLPDLVIVGDDVDPDYSAQMRAAREAAHDLQERIRIVGTVPYAEIPAWYRGAQLFVFLSYLETFGHPLLEAMAADVPVIAADIPVSREVAGDAALYVPHDDVAALADAMAHGLDDAEFRKRAVALGQERVARFTWDASARAHLALFDELVNP